MINVCFCYNNNYELLKDELKKELTQYPEIQFESFNEDSFVERKKSFKIKKSFAAKKIPFCGVFKDNKMIKGFYTEANECTTKNISKFLFEHFAFVII